MKVIYTKKELGRYFRLTAMGILASMVRVPWCMVLVVVHLGAGFVRLVKMCVKRGPMRTLLFTLAGMSLLTIVVFMDMKVRLTTCEWQRDSLRQKVDSAEAWKKGHTVKYVGYEGDELSD